MKQNKTISCFDISKTSSHFKIFDEYAESYNISSYQLRNNLIVKVLKNKRYDFEPGTFLMIDRTTEIEDNPVINDFKVYGEFDTLQEAIEKQEEFVNSFKQDDGN